MKRQKLKGLHLWFFNSHYWFLTKNKRVEDAVKKARKYGLSILSIEYRGYIDG